MEKRRAKRKQLFYYLSVFDRNTHERVGQLVNITTRGLMLTSENFVKPDIVFQLRMTLPQEIKGEEEISFDARSCWCKKGINPDFYDIGFELTDISKKNVRIIENLIYEFSFHS
ncbi:MAG: hypothetical protein B6245_08700 [Desulfobacteraceae bacterium 4572_88]|nr:MAG: hypothetical protein B6245_08700 [Desulfobacteraceae bacterium 4572_88]